MMLTACLFTFCVFPGVQTWFSDSTTYPIMGIMVFAVGFCSWKVLAMNADPTTEWDRKNRSTLDYVEDGNKLNAKETAKHYANSSFKQGPGFTSEHSKKILKGKHDPNGPRAHRS